MCWSKVFQKPGLVTHIVRTKIVFDDIRHGKAWGVLIWEGEKAEKQNKSGSLYNKNMEMLR